MKAVAVLLIACLLFVAMPVSGAEEAQKLTPDVKGNPLTKFSRGLCNIVTFHFEIPEQFSRVKAKEGVIAASTYGVIKGILMSVTRASVGIYEVVTSPFPYPDSYKPILTDPVSYFPEPKQGAV